MWFGDLVTMKWWNGIWLNEAFATFMEVTASRLLPARVGRVDRRSAWPGPRRSTPMRSHSTRPIEYEVVTAADAEGMFDVLTYEKGASVLRMLEQYLGAERFRDGIRAYLRRHAYANTETTDLWDALEEVTGEPVRRIMDAWIFRGGHPLVTVTPTPSGVHVDQERFSFDGSTDDARWPVPMVLTTPVTSGSEHRLLLEDATDLDLGGSPAWIQPNRGGSGFYRSALPTDLRTALVAASDSSPLERFVLIDDTWAAFLADRATFDDVTALIRAAGVNEADPSVWRRLSAVAGSLHHLLPGSRRGGVASLVREVVIGPLDTFDAAVASGPTERSQDVRSILFSMLGVIGDEPAVRARASDIVSGAEADAPLSAAAVAVVAAWADADDHDLLERRWREATNPQDEIRYLYSLADTPDADCFAHTLDLTRTKVRTQNAPYLLRRALGNADLGPQAWEFITTHWDELLERFPSNSHVRMIEGIRGFTDRDLAGSVEAFLAENPLGQGHKQVSQHIERMWVTVAAAERLA